MPLKYNVPICRYATVGIVIDTFDDDPTRGKGITSSVLMDRLNVSVLVLV